MRERSRLLLLPREAGESTSKRSCLLEARPRLGVLAHLLGARTCCRERPFCRLPLMMLLSVALLSALRSLLLARVGARLRRSCAGGLRAYNTGCERARFRRCDVAPVDVTGFSGLDRDHRGAFRSVDFRKRSRTSRSRRPLAVTSSTVRLSLDRLRRPSACVSR